jgi:hypothetical protein
MAFPFAQRFILTQKTQSDFLKKIQVFSSVINNNTSSVFTS